MGIPLRHSKAFEHSWRLRVFLLRSRRLQPKTGSISYDKKIHVSGYNRKRYGRGGVVGARRHDQGDRGNTDAREEELPTEARPRVRDDDRQRASARGRLQRPVGLEREAERNKGS